MAQIQDFVFNLITSGKISSQRGIADMEKAARYSIFNVALASGGIMLAGFGLTAMLSGQLTAGIIYLSLALVCIVSLFISRTNIPIPLFVSGFFPITLFGILCGLFLINGEAGGFGAVWIFAFPMISIFVLGMRSGAILSLLLLGFAAFVTFVPGMAAIAYDQGIAIRFSGVYALILVLAIAYEKIHLTIQKWTRDLTRSLRAEHDEISGIMDNLKIGFFMLNNDFEIQGAYPRALEDMFIENDLQGKKFTDIISASVKAKELETIKDYFGMIINRSFGQDMLDEINPIRELNYVHRETKGERILTCSFTSISRSTGKVYILGTIEDVTLERHLARQLEEEEGRRQEEVLSIFEVINVHPGIFNDFIEDTEYAFARLNDLLKDTSLSSEYVMNEIFQSVHAIKADAIVLGLDSFSKKMHRLEDKIKTLQDKEELSFEDLLHITVEIEQIMKAKDQFKESREKILAFKAEDCNNTQTLIASLSKLCERTTEETSKNARFVVETINSDAMDSGMRRVIKEVLMQLVRNSVVHGIEESKEREAAGKEAQGVICLSITIEGKMIHICLRDDGRGLDFEKIKRKAIEMGLLSADSADDKNMLLRTLFSPNFSTAETVSMHAGRGVGLSLVQELLRVSSGTIKVNSAWGKGTSFHVFLPFVAA